MLFAKADRLLDGSRKIKFQIPNIKKRNERKISNSDIRSLNFFYDYGPALFLKVNQFLDNGNFGTPIVRSVQFSEALFSKIKQREQ